MENNSISLAALANSANYSAMSYAELVELNLAYLWALGDIKKLMDVKRKEEMAIITSEYVAKMNALSATEAEIYDCLGKEKMAEESIFSSPAMDVEMQEAEVVEDNQNNVEAPLCLPEPTPACSTETEEAPATAETNEDVKEVPATGSAFDNPAVKAPFKSKRKKNADKATPETKEQTLVEKAIEMAKTLPLAEGTNVDEPYFVTYEFEVSKKGDITLVTKPFGRNEDIKTLNQIKMGCLGLAKKLNATDVISTENCAAYMWYNGKCITVEFYNFPINSASSPDSEEALPTMEELLSDDPMYKAHYAAPSPIKKSKMITMEELLSGEPVNEILNLGNLKPEDAPFRQHTRVCDASGICPTLTATGNTTNVYLGS